MTQFLEAVLLGVVEGLTEFIPVSSTGHLVLLGDLLGFKGPPGKVFEVVIQLGAILAVCFKYRSKFTHVVMGFLKEKQSRDFVLNLLVAFLPAAIIGIMAHGFIKTHLFSPVLVSVMLILGGIAIIIIENFLAKKPAGGDEIGRVLALKIGFCQALAMIPGVSRSGATIMGALLLGVSRRVATEFSFFLAVPTMLAATVYDLYKNRGGITGEGVELIAVGFVAAFMAALLVVDMLVDFVSKNGFKPFAYYRIGIGVLMLALLF